MNIEVGKIEILLENVSSQETERIRKLINTLFSSGISDMRNGWMKLNFDNDMNLSSIEKNNIVWRQNYLAKSVNDSIIVTTIS